MSIKAEAEDTRPRPSAIKLAEAVARTDFGDGINVEYLATRIELVIRAEIASAIKAAVEAEREACAKMCDEGVKWYPEQAYKSYSTKALVQESCAKLARDIRSRSEKPG